MSSTYQQITQIFPEFNDCSPVLLFICEGTKNIAMCHDVCDFLWQINPISILLVIVSKQISKSLCIISLVLIQIVVEDLVAV